VGSGGQISAWRINILPVFVAISLSFNENTGTVPQIRARLLPSTSLPVHYSSIILSLVKFEPLKAVNGSRDSSVGITTCYGLGGRGSIPDRDKIFFSSPVLTQALKSTHPPIQWVSGLFSPGVKRQGREADHSPPSSAEVKKGGAILSLPHTSSWRGA
jgi:hypothetical protein